MLHSFTTKNYNRLFLELLAHCESSGRVSAQVLQDFLLKSDADTARWPSDDEFRKALEEDALYRLLTRSRLRLLLRTVNHAIESEKSEDIQLPEELTIEHILPQSWQEHWPLPEMDGEGKGNPTPRSFKAHPRKSNAAYKKAESICLEFSVDDEASRNHEAE